MLTILLLFLVSAVVFTTAYSSYYLTFLNSFPQHCEPQEKDVKSLFTIKNISGKNEGFGKLTSYFEKKVLISRLTPFYLFS